MGIDSAVREMCINEYFSYHLYRSLAGKPFVGKNLRETLLKASEDEYRHYLFWRSIVGECSSSISMFKMFIYTVMFYLFGLTALLKILEAKERSAKAIYKEIAKLKHELKEEVEKMILDEEKHEKEFLLSIDEGRVRYIGAITLGISDALIELTGIYTGSLGAFENTLSAGLTGLLAGIAASISMGVASYTQAKNEGRANPGLAAIYTLIAYISVALLLATPYFIINNLIKAFIAMVVIALAIVSYLTFYVAILHNRSYIKEFGETAIMIFGVSILLYILGSTLGKILGIKPAD
jgi:VIT1/CCC1 family predicted Fe2+/Mn2+ transporter